MAPLIADSSERGRVGLWTLAAHLPGNRLTVDGITILSPKGSVFFLSANKKAPGAFLPGADEKDRGYYFSFRLSIRGLPENCLFSWSICISIR